MNNEESVNSEEPSESTSQGEPVSDGLGGETIVQTIEKLLVRVAELEKCAHAGHTIDPQVIEQIALLAVQKMNEQLRLRLATQQGIQ